MEKELTKKQLETIWFKAYDLLSNAGFEILIDDCFCESHMIVGHRDYELLIHPNKGMMLKKIKTK
jgi:hypothetical protein